MILSKCQILDFQPIVIKILNLQGLCSVCSLRLNDVPSPELPVSASACQVKVALSSFRTDEA